MIASKLRHRTRPDTSLRPCVRPRRRLQRRAALQRQCLQMPLSLLDHDTFSAIAKARHLRRPRHHSVSVGSPQSLSGHTVLQSARQRVSSRQRGLHQGIRLVVSPGTDFIAIRLAEFAKRLLSWRARDVTSGCAPNQARRRQSCLSAHHLAPPKLHQDRSSIETIVIGGLFGMAQKA